MNTVIKEITIVGPLGANHELFHSDPLNWDYLIVDFGQMSFINSVAIREWVLWSKRISDDKKVILRRCPTSLVNQFNQVNGFLRANFEVESFSVPMVCEDCNIESSVQLQIEKDFFYPTETEPGAYNPPKLLNCPSCNDEMEFDVIENKYFNFLKKPIT